MNIQKLNKIRHENNTLNLNQFKLIHVLSPIIQTLKTFKASETIYFSRDTPKNIYFIQSGLCKEYSLNLDGNEFINEFYYSGEILGLEYIHNSPYYFDAIALKKSTIAVINIIKFKQAMLTNSELNTQMFKITCEKIKNYEEIYLTTPAKKRVASFFLNLYKRYNQNFIVFRNSIPNEVSLLDISNKLGIALATLKTIIQTFNKNNILSISDDFIIYKNLNELMNICYFN